VSSFPKQQYNHFFHVFTSGLSSKDLAPKMILVDRAGVGNPLNLQLHLKWNQNQLICKTYTIDLPVFLATVLNINASKHAKEKE
jgi:hypothetical protein